MTSSTVSNDRSNSRSRFWAIVFVGTVVCFLVSGGYLYRSIPYRLSVYRPGFDFQELAEFTGRSQAELVERLGCPLVAKIGHNYLYFDIGKQFSPSPAPSENSYFFDKNADGIYVLSDAKYSTVEIKLHDAFVEVLTDLRDMARKEHLKLGSIATGAIARRYKQETWFYSIRKRDTPLREFLGVTAWVVVENGVIMEAHVDVQRDYYTIARNWLLTLLGFPAP